MKKIIFIGILLVFIFIFSFVAFARTQQSNKNVIIFINDTSLIPEKISIQQYDAILFKNTGENIHWPASDLHPEHIIYQDFNPQYPIESGTSWAFTFTLPGTWKYSDRINPQLHGEIHVTRLTFLQHQFFLFNQLYDSIENSLNSFLISIHLKKPDEQFSQQFANTSAQDILDSDTILFSYLKKFGVRQTLQHLEQLVPTAGDCHQTAHRLGRFALDLYGEAAFQMCTADCQSGCYHGVMEKFFLQHNSNNLSQTLNSICSPKLNSFFGFQCAHGIGHGLMARENYDIFSALKDCDLFKKNDDAHSCYSGVFMENVVGGLDPNNGHLTKYLNTDPLYPCDMIDAKYKVECYFFQTSRMLQLFPGDFAKIAQECSHVDSIYQPYCFSSMGRDIDGSYNGDVQKVNATCKYVPAGDLRIDCLNGAVEDIFWDKTKENIAMAHCKSLSDQKEKSACYATIFSRATQLLSSQKEINSFCAKAEPGFPTICLSYFKEAEKNE